MGMDERRAARAAWPVRRFTLGSLPLDDISGESTPEDRLAMMWPLAVEAWRTSGRPLPDYDRAHVPARLFGPGEPRPDDDE